MATTTARDIINLSLQEIGVLGIGETATADDITLSFDKLNLMIDSWGTDDLMHNALTEETFSVVSGTGSYSIGTGQTFDTTKPFYINSGYLRTSGNEDYQLDVIHKDDYNREFDKDITGLPFNIIYDANGTQQANQFGTIYFNSVPDQNYTLYLTSLKPFTEFANLNANVTFPAGYKKAIIENLAIDLSTSFGRPIVPELYRRAELSKKAIERINAHNLDNTVTFGFPVSHGSSDIREGF